MIAEFIISGGGIQNVNDWRRGTARLSYVTKKGVLQNWLGYIDKISGVRSQWRLNFVQWRLMFLQWRLNFVQWRINFVRWRLKFCTVAAKFCTVATKFFTVAANIFRFSVWKLLRFIHLASRILKRLLHFFENLCIPSVNCGIRD